MPTGWLNTSEKLRFSFPTKIDIFFVSETQTKVITYFWIYIVSHNAP